MAFHVTYNFVQGYDAGQKKIVASEMDQNFADIEGYINTSSVNIAETQTITGDKTFTGAVDLSGASVVGAPYVNAAEAAHAAMPNWDATINFPSLSTSANWQALSTPAPADGYLRVSASINAYGQDAAIGLRINGRVFPIYNYDATNRAMSFTTMTPVNAGDTFEIYFNLNAAGASTDKCTVVFYYANGTTPTI